MPESQPLIRIAQAFMQTSNDELPRVTNSSTNPAIASIKMLSSDLPEREQVPSASRLPHAPLVSTLTRDSSLGGDLLVDNWRDYCDKQRETFDAERKLWAVERKLLSAQISQLQNELMIANSKLKQLELSNGTKVIENGDLEHSDTSKASAETNATTTEGNLEDRSSSSKVHFASGASELSHDISETNNLQNSLYSDNERIDANFNVIDSTAVLNHAGNDSPSVPASCVLQNEQQPRSPPATALLSPPPENYRRFAGHTPGGSMSGQAYCDPGTAKALHPMLTDKSNNTNALDDIPLKGPLGLGAEPESTPDFLHKLDEKLQDVKDNPEQLTPAVLVGEQIITNGKLSGNVQDEQPSSSLISQMPIEKSASASGTTQSKVYEQVVDGPKLRIKRSMNFGAPLGSLNPPSV